MTSALLASGGWVLDLVFFLLLVLGTAWGAHRGFVAGVCKLAGKWVSLIFAFVFCISFANFLETCFHMTSAISQGIAASIAKNEAYAVGIGADTAGAEISEALKGMNIGAFQRWLIAISFAKVELIPAGTTPALLIGSVLSKWISVVIAFLLLILLVRLGALLISKTFNAIKDKITPIKVVDQALGALLGLAKMCFFVFVLLLICNWLPITPLQEFIGSSTVVGKIFTSQWFQNATSYAISGQWFNDYIKDLLIK